MAVPVAGETLEVVVDSLARTVVLELPVGTDICAEFVFI